MEVLDLFSAAAGGWSLGMHRAGFTTIAACEVEAWRRALYAENNPDVRLYDDVRTLTADRLRADLGRLPSIVVGSPPCQDISSANTKGRGVEGERSGLYFEAVRIIGECRPRWFALENSANLRTRGADAVIAALEAIGYACWPVVVRAGDVGANHERPRAWLIGCDLAQFEHTSSFGYESGRARRYGSDGDRGAYPSFGSAADTIGWGLSWRSPVRSGWPAGNQHAGDRQPQSARSVVAYSDCEGQSNCPEHDEMGRRESISRDAPEPWSEWNLGLARHLRLDDGLSARLAGTRVALGDGKGQSAASLIVEAFGDAVIPQIPEAIGRAIWRVEAALAAIYPFQGIDDTEARRA